MIIKHFESNHWYRLCSQFTHSGTLCRDTSRRVLMRIHWIIHPLFVIQFALSLSANCCSWSGAFNSQPSQQSSPIPSLSSSCTNLLQTIWILHFEASTGAICNHQTKIYFIEIINYNPSGCYKIEIWMWVHWIHACTYYLTRTWHHWTLETHLD